MADDFFEEDEPVEKVREVFERAEKGVTGRQITDAINADPAEVERLRKSRTDARGARPHVRVDPAQRFGRPAVKGISCEAIAGVLLAGEDLAAVAEDYDLRRADVLVACWYLGLYGTRRYRRLWKAWAESAHQQMWHASECDYDMIPDPPVGRTP